MSGTAVQIRVTFNRHKAVTTTEETNGSLGRDWLFWSKLIQPLKYQQFTYVRIKHGIKHGIISSCSFSSLLQGLDVVLGDNILFSVLKQYAKCDVFILQHPSSLVEPKDPDT